MKRLLWISYLSYFFIGFAQIAIGSVLRLLLKHYDIGYDQGGVLIFSQISGFVVGVLAAPWVSRSMGRRGGLMLSFICISVATFGFSMLPAWILILILAPVAGFGLGMVEAVIGALVIEATPFGEKAKTFSLLNVFFGLGAVLMPILSAALIAADVWLWSFVIVGALSIIMTFIWWRIPFSDNLNKLLGSQIPLRHDQLQKSATGYTGISLLILLLFMGIFFLYVGVEVTVANFIPTVMVESLQTNEETALFGVTLLWIAITTGPMYAGAIAEKWGYAAYMLSHTAFAVLFILGILLASQAWLFFLMVFMLGLTLSGLFAIALVYADSMLPGRIEQLTSILIASGGIGGVLLPLFTGWSLKHLSVTSTMLVWAGMIMLMFLLTACVARTFSSVKTLLEKAS